MTYEPIHATPQILQAALRDHRDTIERGVFELDVRVSGPTGGHARNEHATSTYRLLAPEIITNLENGKSCVYCAAITLVERHAQ